MLSSLSVLLVPPGCDRQPIRFEPNLIYMRNQKLARSPEDFQNEAVRQRIEDIERVVTLFCGTPADPRLPVLENLAWESPFDPSLLRMAAGPPGAAADRQVRGLYRSLCVRCHGISGNGRGVLAPLLEPYPRDFRRGIFKFKKTPSTSPPTHDDLHGVLVRGIPGTAMPSFRLLPEVEREALVQYVRYLSLRGLVERAIIAEVAIEMDDDERLLDPHDEEIRPGDYAEQMDWMTDVVEDVAQPWLNAEQEVTIVPPPPAGYGTSESIARGRELFFTTLTNCAKCHGDTALGDGQTDDYDEWAKELEPTNPDVVEDYLALGALPPRKVQPRNLREGIFRGGYRREDVFIKIRNGIAGTTMPVVAAQLNDDDIWHLVAYARYLPFDPIVRPFDGNRQWPDESRSSAGQVAVTRR